MFQSHQNIIKRILGVRTQGAETSGKEQQAGGEHNDEQESASTEYLVHNWLEAMFAWFQVIVLWHEPHISVFAISGLLSSFLLLTYFAPRFYATIMIAIFVYNLNKFWFRHVWPAIRVPPSGDREEEMRLDVDRWTYLHPQLMTLRELQYHLGNLIRISEGHLKRQLQLRRENPTRFCSQLCFIFFCTAYLGQTISGLTLVFSILVIIMSAPGIYAHLLPEEYKEWLRQHYRSLIATDEPQNVRAEESGLANEEIASQKPDMAHGSKETIAASMVNTMKSIESLFGNLKKKAHITSATSTTTTEATTETTTKTTSASTSTHEAETDIQPQQHQPSASVLSNLREDGAKVLYNLIDVTLMAAAGSNRSRSGSQEGKSEEEEEESTELEDSRRTSSEEPSATESVSLLDNEDEQQEEGFVML